MRPVNSPDEPMKGSVFAYRSKSHMVAARGVVVTSIEALLENEGNFTHWTPNVYQYGAYVDEARTITFGHSESNLKQINCFYIDFDITKGVSISSSDILLASLDLGFMPTLILDTDKGCQAYFVLKKPIYLTRHSDFKSLKVAKAISQNLRKYFLKEGLPVDMTCNHFGIARIPRKDNIAFLELEYCYGVEEWMNWSMKQSELLTHSRPNLTILSGSLGQRQIDEPWYKLLESQSKIRGEKALMGRNNVLFTLALAHYASGSEEDVARMAISTFNDQLQHPIKEKELNKILKSAYSGLYQAASREYIRLLCHAWVSEDMTNKDLFIRQKWHKFKKQRAERTNSHFSEWKEDLMAYLEQETDIGQVYLQTTKKNIREALGIPERSLDAVLKQLRQEYKVLFRVKSGRYGGIWIASTRVVFLAHVNRSKTAKLAFIKGLATFFKEGQENILRGLIVAQKELAKPRQLTLFERDIG